MKRFLSVFLFLSLAVLISAQSQGGRLLKFTTASGATMVFSSDDIAFIFPISTSASTLVLGPSAHYFNVTEAVDTIVQRSYGAFVSATQVQTNLRGNPTRTVGVSKAHISEIISDGSYTKVRLRNPLMTVTLSGTIASLYPGFVGESYFTKTDTSNFIARFGKNYIAHSANVATDSVFLPVSPSQGDYVELIYKDTVTTLVVGGSGKTILGVAATSADEATVLRYEYFDPVWIRTK